MKIGFLSQYSPDDRRASSGTNFTIARQLSKIGELKWIPIKKTRIGKIADRAFKAFAKLSGHNADFYSTMTGSKIGYRPIAADAFDDCDIVVSSFCMPLLAHLKISKPIIYFTDATYPAMIGYYYTNRFEFNNRQGRRLERMAMDNADALVFSSQWAANSAIQDLNQSPDKVHVVEYGANIDDKDIIAPEEKLIDPTTLNLLFLGVDWNRKGGDIAVDTVSWLNENGVNAILHIVGIRDLTDEIAEFPFIVNHGFLNKNISDDYSKLIKILSKTDALLLPTKAECAGIAFAEASANGLPVFTHLTGGVGNYVIDGVNGYKLPLGSTGSDFGKKIKETVESGELRSMSASARRLYAERLNWGVWGQRVNKIVNALLSPLK